MKNVLKVSIAALLSSIVLAACGGQQAKAATLPPSFVDSTGAVLNFAQTSRKIIAYSGQFGIVDLTTNVIAYYPDAGNTILPHIKAAPGFAYFAQVAADQWVNMRYVSRLTCANNFIYVAWPQWGSEYFPDPGCAFFATIRANAS